MYFFKNFNNLLVAFSIILIEKWFKTDTQKIEITNKL